MSSATLIGIAVGLAMDAFAVAIATSIALGNVTPRQLFRLSWHFGLFQALMPVFGWTVGLSVERHVKAWDHWVAFGLLAYVGGKALHAAFQPDHVREKNSGDPTRGWSLVLLSVATSIDALAVGFSFSMLGISIWYPAVIIGLVAGTVTLAGMLLGGRLGTRFGRRIEILGGLVLIGIGIKILVEHLTAA